MNPSDLRALIRDRESALVEFKSDRARLSDSDLVETVVCLANAGGGTLLVGVEDNGTVTGLDPSHQTRPDALAALIANRTRPAVTAQVEFISLEEGTVAVVTVPAAGRVVATSAGKAMIRYIDGHGRPGCRPLYPDELESWRADRGLLDLSALPLPDATREDLDPLEFVRLRRMIGENRGDAALVELSDDDLSRALGLVQTRDGVLRPTLAGLLLVGRERALLEHVPAHEVAFQVLRNTDVLVNEFRRWPLLRTVEWLLESFQVRNEERELNIGLFRIGVPAYDRRGFREAVNNALIHRDYARLGAVHIQMHQDHVRVSNPGGFVEGVRIENLLVTDPHPRNPRLADAFKRIGLVERIGRGVSIIFNGQLRNGRLPPDYSLSTENTVSVLLPGGPADLDFVQMVLEQENRQQRPLRVDELLILAHVWRQRSIDTATAAELIQRDEPHARATLAALVEVGLLDRRGAKRGRTYLLSASVYRELGRSADYVRARGFEPEQMEQMILQYVQRYGAIKRQEVENLCRISADQAYRLLKQLKKEKKLDQVGERGREVHYVLPGERD